ncbi:T9SS type A sorting domain-containing protein, partial [Marinilabilia salmonicolor]
RNLYMGEEEQFFYANNNVSLDLAEWQNQLGFDRSSSFELISNRSNHIKVVPNDYQEGRANIVVYNWENLNEVFVDLGDVMEQNDSYTIYDVENIFEPLLSGVYNGKSVEIPMNLSKTIQPSGDGAYAVDHTSSEFGVFLVTKTKSASRVPASTVDTSVDQHSEEMRVYPNPSNTFFNCDFVAENSGLASIKLIDLSGRSVISREQSVSKGENKIVIDVSGLNEGIYILSVSHDGQTKANKVKVF